MLGFVISCSVKHGTWNEWQDISKLNCQTMTNNLKSRITYSKQWRISWHNFWIDLFLFCLIKKKISKWLLWGQALHSKNLFSFEMEQYFARCKILIIQTRLEKRLFLSFTREELEPETKTLLIVLYFWRNFIYLYTCTKIFGRLFYRNTTYIFNVLYYPNQSSLFMRMNHAVGIIQTVT